MNGARIEIQTADGVVRCRTYHPPIGEERAWPAVVYLMDGMVNMMVNPIFMLAGGALTGLAIAAPVRARSTETAPNSTSAVPAG